MNIKLQKMSSLEYDQFLAISVDDYAKDKVEAGTWHPDEAEELSIQAFNHYLPDGIDTEHHYLLSIIDTDKHLHIGFLWVFLNKTDLASKMFIYDFIILEEYRNKGYGKNSLIALEKFAKNIDATEIGLHVFAHNKVALHTYEKHGFIPTDITMSKKIY